MEPPHIRRLIVPKLRGFCAGVVRAVATVEAAIERCETPVYVLKEIVHNRAVVESLRRKGALFVPSLAAVPPGSWVVFSAHGVAPSVREEARARSLRVLDATCPLVMKIHHEARRYARDGFHILFIGHPGHDETIGTMGEAPGSMTLIQTQEDAESVRVPDPGRLTVLTQTTLGLEDTHGILETLRRRFPALVTPSSGDICYANTNRQNAVRALADRTDLVLVIGAPHSSNSVRLVKVAESRGVPAHLIEDSGGIREEWLQGVRAVGIAASASAPESLVQEALAWFRAKCAVSEVEELATPQECVRFPLPPELGALRRAGTPDN